MNGPVANLVEAEDFEELEQLRQKYKENNYTAKELEELMKKPLTIEKTKER
jgi:hypothetical protein